MSYAHYLIRRHSGNVQTRYRSMQTERQRAKRSGYVYARSRLSCHSFSVSGGCQNNLSALSEWVDLISALATDRILMVTYHTCMEHSWFDLFDLLVCFLLPLSETRSFGRPRSSMLWAATITSSAPAKLIWKIYYQQTSKMVSTVFRYQNL